MDGDRSGAGRGPAAQSGRGRGRDRTGAGTAGAGRNRAAGPGASRDGERRTGRTGRDDEAGPSSWGKLARRGAARVGEEHRFGASAAWRAAAPGARPEAPEPTPRGLTPADWVLDEEVEAEASEAVERGRQVRRVSQDEVATDVAGDLDEDVRTELDRALGPGRSERQLRRLREASRAFETERFADALRILRPLAADAPGAASVRELLGVTLYRLGRWRPAIRELEAFRTLTASTEQHPVLADAYRAVHQHDTVRELWDDLRAASPSAELVTEGRIVMAGSLADQGDVRGAVRLLEQGFSLPKRPRSHHLRRAYALADTYERAGEVVRARELFGRIASLDPDFADARRRSRALR